MKNKIYRLADISIDKNKIVYFTNDFTETVSERRKGELTDFYEDSQNYIIQMDREEYHDRKILHGNKVIIHTQHAFVEVTLADFSDEDIIDYLQDKYEGPKKLFVNTREALLHDREVTKHQALGCKMATEKTLADFIEEEVLEEFRKREIINVKSFARLFTVRELSNELAEKGFFGNAKDINKNELFGLNAYSASKKESYEAGKRDAEPKWISVEEKLPEKDGEYFAIQKYFYIDRTIESVAEFKKGDWIPNIYGTITHWMPLPAPPEPEKTEAFDTAEPGADKTVHIIRKDNQVIYKYTCAQCGKKFEEFHAPISTSHFCNDDCYEDYQWIPAEFPRDYEKKCRVKLKKEDDSEEHFYGYEIFGFRKSAYWKWYVLKIDDYDNYQIGRECQVRRDSVEEKKL